MDVSFEKKRKSKYNWYRTFLSGFLVCVLIYNISALGVCVAALEGFKTKFLNNGSETENYKNVIIASISIHSLTSVIYIAFLVMYFMDFKILLSELFIFWIILFLLVGIVIANFVISSFLDKYYGVNSVILSESERIPFWLAVGSGIVNSLAALSIGILFRDVEKTDRDEKNTPRVKEIYGVSKPVYLSNKEEEESLLRRNGIDLGKEKPNDSLIFES